MLSAGRRRRGSKRFIADPKVSAFLAAIERFDYIVTLVVVEHALSGIASRKHLRTKMTPDFHLTYSKNGRNLGSESK